VRMQLLPLFSCGSCPPALPVCTESFHMLRSERPFELLWGKIRVLNSRRHPNPYAKTWFNSTLTAQTPQITCFWERVTELTVKCKRVNRGLFKMAVHTISILFPSYSSDFIHLSLNFLSYKLSKIFQTITM